MWDLIKRIIKKNSNNEDEREVYMVKILIRWKRSKITNWIKGKIVCLFYAEKLVFK